MLLFSFHPVMFKKTKLIVVLPEILPDIVNCPEALVIVQSEVCAEGVPRTEDTTLWLAVIPDLEIVTGRLDIVPLYVSVGYCDTLSSMSWICAPV